MPQDAEDECLCISDMFEREGEVQLITEVQPRIEEIGGVEYLLRCAPNDGGSPGALYVSTRLFCTLCLIFTPLGLHTPFGQVQSKYK